MLASGHETMVTDKQVKKLMKLSKTHTIESAATKADMSVRTARKYLQKGILPSEDKRIRNWETRKNPFESVWEEVDELLRESSRFESKTIFQELQRRYPGQFMDGQLRTLQRRIRAWRATKGEPGEVFFPQVYTPGKLGAFDFTDMNELDITIQGTRFSHKLFHFVLPYSNWETGNICFSESFESLSDGLQRALGKLGGSPAAVRSDRLSAAVNNLKNTKEFTARYDAVLRHYNLRGEKTNPNSGHENGDTEQSHYRFKTAVDQALLLRGSRDFQSREEYTSLLESIFEEKNRNRWEKLSEELRNLQPLPPTRISSSETQTVRVSTFSTIRVKKKTYSVDSRLIGEMVRIVLDTEWIEVYLGIRLIEKIPRIHGEKGHFIQYRHIIDSLVRKPGAFTNYRFREDLFPTIRFRIAYDMLKEKEGEYGAARIYTRILYLAAKESESLVDIALGRMIDAGHEISWNDIMKSVNETRPSPLPEVQVPDIDMTEYDELLCEGGVL